MKKSLFIAALCAMGIVSWADPYKHVDLHGFDWKDGWDLENNTVYHIHTSMDFISSNGIPLITHAKDTVIIMLDKNVQCLCRSLQPGQPGLYVHEEAVVIILGDEGSTLKAEGGSAGCGERGGDGTRDAHSGPYAGQTNRASSGGKGGAGGVGGAPGIGGKGAPSTEGGAGGAGGYNPKNDARSGDDGQPGNDGHQGGNMGILYVMGDIHVTAKRGDAAPEVVLPDGGNPGNTDSNGLLFAYTKCSAGGGGGAGGKGGRAPYDFGGGGGSGGSGGGGGGGAFDYAGGFKNKTIWSHGAGGLGGTNADGVQGNAGKGERGERTREGKQGGNRHSQSAQPGQAGGSGSFYATDSSHIHGNYYRIKPVLPAINPLKGMVRYNHNKVEVTSRPDDYKFCYGGRLPSSVAVPKPVKPTILFKGYYHNGNQVYNENGVLQSYFGVGRLLYTLDDVVLYAHWEGETRAVTEIRVQNPEDETRFDVDSVHVDSLKTLEECTPITIQAPAMRPHCDKVDSASLTRTICMGDEQIFTFHYYRITNMAKWVYAHPEDQAIVKMVDASGSEVSHIQLLKRSGQRLVVPATRFVNPEDEQGYSLRWLYQDATMPDLPVTDSLFLTAHRFPILVEANDHGHVQGSVPMQPDSVTYHSTRTWTMVPDKGYHADSLVAFELVSGIKGQRVALECQSEDKTVWSISRMPAKTLLLVQYYSPIQYRVYDQTYDDKGKPIMSFFPLYYTMQEKKKEPALYFRYRMGDNVVCYLNYTDYQKDKYFGVPEVRDLSADTIIPVQVIYQETQVNAMVTGISDSIAVAYAFAAPAANCSVNWTVYWREKGKCYFFNQTEYGVIDSTMVNGHKQNNAIYMSENDSASVRALDIVSIALGDGSDTAAVKAGYWDEQSQYQPLSVHAYKERTPSGRYKTFCYLIAPEAKEMNFGLIDGLKIIPQQIHTLTQWLAPGAANAGDTIEYEILLENPRCLLDSVVLRDINGVNYYKSAYTGGQFVMPDHTLFVYTYAHEDTQKYAVTFLNINGDTLQKITDLHYGDSVAYTGTTPVMPTGTGMYRLVYQGWEPAVHRVRGNDVYHAQYKVYIRLHDDYNNDTILNLVDGYDVGIDLHRPMNTQNYTTVAFPFTLTMPQVDSLFGTGTIVGEFSSMDKVDNTLTFYFSKLFENDTLYAGHPYLMLAGKKVSDMVIDHMHIIHRLDTVEQDYALFRPHFNPYWMNDKDYSLCFFSYNRLCWPARPSGPFRGLRAHFLLTHGTSALMTLVAAPQNANFDMDEMDGNMSADPYSGEWTQEATDIVWTTPVDSQGQVTKILHNGILYIRVHEVTYDAQGQKITNK